MCALLSQMSLLTQMSTAFVRYIMIVLLPYCFLALPGSPSFLSLLYLLSHLLFVSFQFLMIPQNASASVCSTRPDGSGPSSDLPTVGSCDTTISSVWEEVYLDLHSSVLATLKKERPYGHELVALLQRRADSKLLLDRPARTPALTDQICVANMRGIDRRKQFWPGEFGLLSSIINRLVNDRKIEENPRCRLPEFSDFCAGSLEPGIPFLHPRYEADLGARDRRRRYGEVIELGGTRVLLYTAAVGEPPVITIELSDSDPE